MHSPVVSIVLPTFNRLPLLREAVRSVLAQSYPKWELIIVDDGSTDGTIDWCRSIGDSRVRPVSAGPRHRPAVLRNLGVGHARGTWIAFLDSDDTWHPEKLARQLAARPSSWSYTGFDVVDQQGRTLPRQQVDLSPSEGIVADVLQFRAVVPCPTVLVLRSLFDSVNGFDESLVFCEDYDLWLRLALESPPAAVHERLTTIRLHPDSYTHARPAVTASFANVYRAFRSDHPEYASICRRKERYFSLYHARQSAAVNWRTSLHSLWSAAKLNPLHPSLWRSLASVAYHGGGKATGSLLCRLGRNDPIGGNTK